MRLAITADERTGGADAVVEEVRRRGHEPLLHAWFAGAPSADADDRANADHLDEIA